MIQLHCKKGVVKVKGGGDGRRYGREGVGGMVVAAAIKLVKGGFAIPHGLGKILGEDK